MYGWINWLRVKEYAIGNNRSSSGLLSASFSYTKTTRCLWIAYRDERLCVSNYDILNLLTDLTEGIKYVLIFDFHFNSAIIIIVMIISTFFVLSKSHSSIYKQQVWNCQWHFPRTNSTRTANNRIVGHEWTVHCLPLWDWLRTGTQGEISNVLGYYLELCIEEKSHLPNMEEQFISLKSAWFCIFWTGATLLHHSRWGSSDRWIISWGPGLIDRWLFQVSWSPSPVIEVCRRTGSTIRDHHSLVPSVFLGVDSNPSGCAVTAATTLSLNKPRIIIN